MLIRYKRPLLAALLLLSLPAFALNLPTFTVPQFGVLGCTFNGNVGTFTTCVVNSSSNAAKAAEQQVRAELENSPYMARIDAERELLTLARNSGIDDLVACMNAAGLNFATVAGSIAANPMGVAGNRLEALIGVLQAQGPQRLAGTFNPAGTGNLPSLQQRIDEAYQTLRDLAAADPLANCLLPMLDSQAAQIKATSASIYQQVSGQLDAIRFSVVEPQLRQRQAQLLNTMLAEMRAVTPAPGRADSSARTVRKKVRQGEKPRARPTVSQMQRERQAAAASQSRKQPQTTAERQAYAQRRTPATTTSDKRKVPAVRSQPRTRSISSFLNDQVQTGRETVASALDDATPAVRNMVESSLPDDVKRIALAEFTGHVLAPEPLAAAAGELDQLADAVTDNATAAGAAELAALLAQLELSNEDMYTRIALATIRFYGHRVVDEVGYPIVDWLWGNVAGVEAVADNAVGEICDLAYYATSLPCAGVKAVISYLVHSLMITSVTKASVMAMHGSWDDAVACGAAAINGTPQNSTCSWLSPMLQGFPRTNQQALSFIMPHLDATQRALFDYQRAVNRLAAAVSAGSAGR